MAEHVIKLPDVGEGVAEAELVEWHVKVGDIVREDSVLAAVMTDKATVEIPAPLDGTVSWLGAEVGDTVAVGSPLVKIEVGGGAAETAPEPAAVSAEPETKTAAPEPEATAAAAPPPEAPKPAPRWPQTFSITLIPPSASRTIITERSPTTVRLKSPVSGISASSPT
jgi:2-oxoisovalerate dehydrogenase E2 component (dihydrolipoyl transacylase)